ncbi:MAG: hypothetical protein J5J06_15835 [Phycisphaerae bacterium]|nr:hypothetical protein [Phycisphaerae bacterium]
MSEIVKRVSLHFPEENLTTTAKVANAIIRPVYIREEGEDTCVYLLVDDKEQTTDADFFLLATNEAMPPRRNAEWLGSYVRGDGEVWHLFVEHRADKGHKFWKAYA